MSATIISYDKALPEVTGASPFRRPDRYLRKLDGGRYEEVLGRRPSDMFLVEKLRAAVDHWRAGGYPGATDITRRLFHFWFDEDHLVDGQLFRYYFAQREAIETLVYLAEVRRLADFEDMANEFGAVPRVGLFEQPFRIFTAMSGQRQLTHYVPDMAAESTVDIPGRELMRYAFKMATGSGKTLVMAMVMVWSYYNRRESGARGLYSDNFLVVAPNIIVFERLERDFANNKIFHELPLIPSEWKGQWSLRVILRGDSALPDPGGNLFLLNIDQIHTSREQSPAPLNPVDAILGRAPKKDLAAYQPSMLERIKSLSDLAVFNDEAHHVHDDDLAWNKTLLELDGNLRARRGFGLNLWLDFSATPKTQAGTYFPWIVVDYPLAQAIEDSIVKAPLIVHKVQRADPPKVTADNVVGAYHDWIVVALERWREHDNLYSQFGQKPVLFIMCERTAYADVLGEHIRKQYKFKKDEVLVIHTDKQGNIQQGDLDTAREAARNVDQPSSKVKIIVSVLMLREGWDVKNVTVILGLRPFSSDAKILPEQAVGRGLRLMPNISPDSRQTVEVIGTNEFEKFVRQLEHEGVGIDTVGEAPPLPIKIYPVQEKRAYDIAIPLTKPRYKRELIDLSSLDFDALTPIYHADVLAEELAIEIEMAFATTGTAVHATTIMPGRTLLSQDALRDMTQKAGERTALDGHFAALYGIVKRYVRDVCFGQTVDLDQEAIKNRLRDPLLQEGIVTYLSRRINELATQESAIEFEDAKFKLSATAPFVWRRKHLACERTIFNAVAVYNDLEARFAKFVSEARDVVRFAALAESYTRFRVDYLSSSGGIRFYYPDFVVVQNTAGGEVNWIIETKGREDGEVAHKDAAIAHWCATISAQTGQAWRYLKVGQKAFDAFEALKREKQFEALLAHIEGRKLPGLFDAPV